MFLVCKNKLVKYFFASIQFKILNRTMNNNLLIDIFNKSVESVQPFHMIRRELIVDHEKRHLTVRGQTYLLTKPCYVVGFGKAVLGMAIECERVLCNLLQRGVVTIPKGILNTFKDNKNMLPSSNSKITFIEGAQDNIPDKQAQEGAEMIKELVTGLNEQDLLIVLISGGGSALLPIPIPPVTLKEKQAIIKKLSKKGADILELNCVRKQISVLKGGGLAEISYPCKVISLILSDIIRDPLDYIASGPTTPNKESPEQALQIIRKYSLYEETPESIKGILQGNQISKSNTLVFNGKYRHVENCIIGNNKIAAKSAKEHASALGFQSAVVSTEITGNVNNIAEIYAGIARNIALILNSNNESLRQCLESWKLDLNITESSINKIINMDFGRDICLIFAGEPTVEVKGSGKGGRNQQLALAFSVELNKFNLISEISFLSCGTDGIDGPTEAAGAIGTSDLVDNCLRQNIKPQDYLDNNDSYNFYSIYNSGNNLVRIGHTGTNVMDIHVMIIKTKTTGA